MQDRIIKPGSSYTLTLSADARLSQIDYFNDQIWNLVINRGEPPGIALETTYGLRARSQRLFPRFTEGDASVTSPLEFHTPVVISAAYPNYVQLIFTPIDGIEAELSYWIATSQVVTGQVVIQNKTSTDRQVQVEWISLLIPNANGQRMAAVELENVNILHGQTETLEPVLFVAGGGRQSNGSYTSLIMDLNLQPNAQARSICALASLDDRQASFDLARATASRNLAAETARIAMTNSSQIQVITGNAEWNDLLAQSQAIAAGLIIESKEHLPETTFVLSRQPDHGFSIRGNESEYSNPWINHTALQAFYLSQELLPQYPEYGRAFLENFLAVQTEDGFIDWKPGPGKQRSSLAATPILCHLAWCSFEQIQDTQFLNDIYPKLLKFLDYWLAPERDRDQDGIPEWDHVFQTGFEDNPMFSYWTQGARGIQISTVESPDLCSFLYNEIQALIKMAEILGDLTHIQRLTEKALHLHATVNKSWNSEKHCYLYWDRDGHNTQISQTLVTHQQAGNFPIQQHFTEPVRLQFNITRPPESTRRLLIFIHGTTPTGGHRVERIEPEQIEWHMEKGYVTCEKIYSEIEKIVVEGLREDDFLTIRTLGLEDLDQTLFMPIWARLADPMHVEETVKYLLTNQDLFLRKNGISTLPGSNQGANRTEIHIPFNALIINGLLSYGFRSEAAEIMTRLMNMFAENYLREGTFRRAYNADQALGIGDVNSLEGLPPLKTFLEVLGIEILSPWKIKIQEFNPFPWPVTVKYCGTSILRQAKKTTLVFSDGQTVTFDDGKPHLISMQ